MSSSSFRQAKTIVILVADGQQFFVRPGTASQLQREIFGPQANVVGLITRGSTPLGADSKPDWLRAWRIFNSNQWIEAIETVRRELVGANGEIMLYGRSGGAYLVHQYLAKRGQHVSLALTQLAVNPFIARELGCRSTRFGPNWQSRILNFSGCC